MRFRMHEIRYEISYAIVDSYYYHIVGRQIPRPFREPPQHYPQPTWIAEHQRRQHDDGQDDGDERVDQAGQPQEAPAPRQRLHPPSLSSPLQSHRQRMRAGVQSW